MKYAMVIIESDEELKRRSTAERDFDTLIRWWADLKARGKIVTSARLASTRPITSIAFRGNEPVTTDGPYLEAKETIGGFAILDVSSYAEAIEIIASMPDKDGFRIEVRRVIESPVMESPVVER